MSVTNTEIRMAGLKYLDSDVGVQELGFRFRW